MIEALQELGVYLDFKCIDCVQFWDIIYGELIVTVVLLLLVSFVDFLKTDVNCQFILLVDIMVVDYPSCAKRFDMIYYFLSMYQNQRICVRVQICDDDMMPFIIGVYLSANWFEREVFDMFGILFTGHLDLRCILIDYGFCGHLLCKDFLTTGYIEVCYDEVQKRVVYELVSLVQEYCQFDFMLPWEEAKYVLFGDDKVKAEGK